MSKAAKRERQKQNRELARAERERMVKRQRQMRSLRTLGFLLAPLVIIAVLIAVFSSSDNGTTTTTLATIETSEGTIVTKLDTENAPKASNRFIELAKQGYYDDKCIDRLAPDFVIQGGSPNCDQQGGEGNPVTGEVPTDNYPIGSLAGAKTGTDAPGTFDSQFFIVTGSQGATLPNDYARFGSVVSGLDVAQKIEQLPVEPGTEKPATKVTIVSVKISTTDKPVKAEKPPSNSTTTAPPADSTPPSAP